MGSKSFLQLYTQILQILDLLKFRFFTNNIFFLKLAKIKNTIKLLMLNGRQTYLHIQKLILG
jgi:hypothetical protein